jgi:hypothetical protein
MSRKKSRPQSSTKSAGWDQAIADAQQLLEKVEMKAARVRSAIRTFKEARAEGEPYIGQSADQTTEPCHRI